MSNLRNAAQQLLEAYSRRDYDTGKYIDALRIALSHPEQKPVAWMLRSGHGTAFRESISDDYRALELDGRKVWIPLYTSPP